MKSIVFQTQAVAAGLSGNAISQTEEVAIDDYYTYEVTAVVSSEGEQLNLDSTIVLEDAVERWLSEIQDVVGVTLDKMTTEVIGDIAEGGPLEELAIKVNYSLAFVFYFLSIFIRP